MTLHEMLTQLRRLKGHKNTTGFTSWDDFRSLVSIQEILLLQEVKNLAAFTETDVYNKGYELGNILGSTFELKKGNRNHFELGRYFATQQGYKSDADLYIAYIKGFQDGLQTQQPKELNMGDYPGS